MEVNFDGYGVVLPLFSGFVVVFFTTWELLFLQPQAFIHINKVPFIIRVRESGENIKFLLNLFSINYLKVTLNKLLIMLTLNTFLSNLS